MTVKSTNPTRVEGNWTDGYVLDRHVVSSTLTHYDEWNHPRFETVRTELGEQVFQLKNRNGDAGNVVDTAVDFIRQRWPHSIDAVTYPPPSAFRHCQPARTLADGVASALGVPLLDAAVIKTKSTAQMKNVEIANRAALLAGAIEAGDSTQVKGKRILVVDDLWETGSTMNRVAAVLKEMGAAEVRIIAMTRTK